MATKTTQQANGYLHLKVPAKIDEMFRAGASLKFGNRKGSLQRYLAYCLLMTVKMEEILDKNIGTKKQVHGIIHHELNAYFKPTQK